MSKTDTHQQIMDTAQALLQTKGFHAFSYADIAEEVGIRKASIHYHFATKHELGEALIHRYRDSFNEARANIDELHESKSTKSTDALQSLKAYIELYRSALKKDNRMCLCGMLAADFVTLPESIQTEVRAFMSENTQWIAGVLEQARASKQIHFDGDAQEEASFFFATLEGAMLVARSMGFTSKKGGLSQFDQMVKQLFLKYTQI